MAVVAPRFPAVSCVRAGRVSRKVTSQPDEHTKAPSHGGASFRSTVAGGDFFCEDGGALSLGEEERHSPFHFPERGVEPKVY